MENSIFKHGSTLFVHNKFKLSDKGTWMSPFIRFALSQDDPEKGLKEVFYNHCASLIEINGILYVLEAGYNKSTKNGEMIITPFEKWKLNRCESTYTAIYPKFEFDKDKYLNYGLSIIGIKYDLFGVLIAQPIKLMSKGNKKWIGGKGEDSFFCSKACARLYNVATNDIEFKDWFKTDPEELFIFVK